MQNNKKIGIIGGVGPQATNYLYQKIIEFSQKKYGAKNNNDYPHVIVECVPIPDFISNTNDLALAKKMLVNTTSTLALAGATKLAIASNTVHLLIDDLRKETDVDFLSMIEAVRLKVQESNCRKVGILGSSVSIRENLYKDILTTTGIQAIIPSAQDQKIVDVIIRHVLAGTDNCNERNSYINILNNLIEKGAQCIVLGCTELPSAINYEALGSKIIDSMAVLTESLVDYYYN